MSTMSAATHAEAEMGRLAARKKGTANDWVTRVLEGAIRDKFSTPEEREAEARAAGGETRTMRAARLSRLYAVNSTSKIVKKRAHRPLPAPEPKLSLDEFAMLPTYVEHKEESWALADESWRLGVSQHVSAAHVPRSPIGTAGLTKEQTEELEELEASRSQFGPSGIWDAAGAGSWASPEASRRRRREARERRRATTAGSMMAGDSYVMSQGSRDLPSTVWHAPLHGSPRMWGPETEYVHGFSGRDPMEDPLCTVYRPSSRTGSRAGSRSGSRAGSRAGSRPVSRGGGASPDGGRPASSILRTAKGQDGKLPAASGSRARFPPVAGGENTTDGEGATQFMAGAGESLVEGDSFVLGPGTSRGGGGGRGGGNRGSSKVRGSRSAPSLRSRSSLGGMSGHMRRSGASTGPLAAKMKKREEDRKQKRRGMDRRGLKYWSSCTVMYSQRENEQSIKAQAQKAQKDRAMRSTVKWRELAYMYNLMRMPTRRQAGIDELDGLYATMRKACAERGTTNTLDRDTFWRIVSQQDMPMTNANRLYSGFDLERRDELDIRQFICSLRLFRRPNEDLVEKLATLYSVYLYHDHTGKLRRADVVAVMQTCADTELDKEVIDRHAQKAMNDMLGTKSLWAVDVTVDDFQKMLRTDPMLLKTFEQQMNDKMGHANER